MADDAPSGKRVLLVELSSCACALSLADVIETMRPRPIEPIHCALPFVQGVSMIRGTPTPVIDLNALLGTHGGISHRFVTVRLGDRQVALAVAGVLGVRDFDARDIKKMPLLLEGVSKEIVEAMGTLDEQMLMFLKAGWRLPDEVWQALAAREAAQ